MQVVGLFSVICANSCICGLSKLHAAILRYQNATEYHPNSCGFICFTCAKWHSIWAETAVVGFEGLTAVARTSTSLLELVARERLLLFSATGSRT